MPRNLYFSSFFVFFAIFGMAVLRVPEELAVQIWSLFRRHISFSFFVVIFPEGSRKVPQIRSVNSGNSLFHEKSEKINDFGSFHNVAGTINLETSTNRFDFVHRVFIHEKLVQRSVGLSPLGPGHTLGNELTEPELSLDQ